MCGGKVGWTKLTCNGLVGSQEVRRPSVHELCLIFLVPQVFVLHLAFQLHSPISSFKKKRTWYIMFLWGFLRVTILKMKDALFQISLASFCIFLGITLLSFISVIKDKALPVKCAKVQHFSLYSLPKHKEGYFSFCYVRWLFFPKA